MHDFPEKDKKIGERSMTAPLPVKNRQWLTAKPNNDQR